MNTPTRSATNWWPFILQALLLLGAAFTWTIAQEHRFTSLEEKVNAATIQVKEQQSEIKQMSAILQRLVDLNEFNAAQAAERRK